MSGQLTRPLLDALNPEALGDLAQAMRTKAQQYEPQQSQFPRRLRFPAGGDEWTGKASDALQQRAGLVARTYGDTTHALGAAAGQLDQAQGFISDSRKTARQFIGGVEDKDVTLGTGDGKMWPCGKPFQVADDFTVQVKPGAVPAGAPYQIGELLKLIAYGFTEDIKRLVQQLEDLGQTWAGKIKEALDLSKLALDSKGQPYQPYDPSRAAHEQAAAIADGTMDIPSDPKQLHDLWLQLSPTEKDAIYDRYHDIGNHGGIPFDDRDHYNRANLDRMTKHAEQELAAINQHPPEVPISGGKDAEQYEKDWAAWQAKRKALQQELDGYNNIRATLDRSGKDGVPRFLGTVDDKGHAAVALYNPDRARDTATVVPGTFSDLSTLEAYDQHSQDIIQSAIKASHGQLHEGDVSVTEWLGYDRPMTISGIEGTSPWAGDPDPALRGAKALDDYQAGIRASHDDAAAGGRSYNTVIGHSYGTTEVGAAATHGNHLDADAVVLLASPGAFADNAHGLSLPEGAKVFVGKSFFDPIDIANVGAAVGLSDLGSDPSLWDDAYRIDAGLGGHSSYWDPDNPAMKNLGQIITRHDGSNGVTPY
ncbi:alpha/beta hydrolase [Segniliparus rugosus]|uniref:DUF1023 domain-containing protein n=1 Tax=Segniliparus rugosus (strain ATCC BAA-974 / DSM 45345 / CCUG 50838 / CIP 108380 / JCM 13579 / CDC 945) TaxID=679197 RepID=U1M2K6_SEGRC|nr:alpha/beta hydrolase [Segniliparus rugosus]ERG69345.1 hypothetical protein HMPREF9336_04236 [Segniliparus rugosus ATCC BAA-974]